MAGTIAQNYSDRNPFDFGNWTRKHVGVLFELAGVLHDPAHVFEHEFAFEPAKAAEKHVIGQPRSFLGFSLDSAALCGQEEELRTFVGWVRPALHESVAFHARQRVGNCGLLYLQPVDKVALRQSILVPKGDKDRELARRESQKLGAFLKRARKSTSHQA